MSLCETEDPYAQVEEYDYIKVAAKEDADFMEFPKEDSNSITLSTIQAQFPNAIGIKYRGSSGAWRAIRAVDNILDPPKGGWANRVYVATLPESTKRKSANDDSTPRESKITKVESGKDMLKDMAVIGLPFKTTDEELKEYFETNYGELAFSEVKKDRETGKSKGFGFIRFKEAECGKAAVNGRHSLLGRSFEVRAKKEKAMKLFVGRLSAGTTQEDLQKYFGQYGEVTDSYIPTPFKGFGFITMASTEDGKLILRGDHTLNDAQLNVMIRNPDSRAPMRDGAGGKRFDARDAGRDGGRRDDNRGSRSSGYSASSNYSSIGPSMSQHYSSSTDSRSTAPNNDVANDLKNMLFQLLTR